MRTAGLICCASCLPPSRRGEDAARVWAAEFADGIDHDALSAWLSTVDETSHNEEVYHLVDVLAGLAPSAASTALRACAEHMTASFESDLADASHGMARWVFGHMNSVAHVAAALHAGDADTRATEALFDDEDLGDDERWVPSPEFIELAKATLEVMRTVDWHRAGTSLNGGARHGIESLDLLLAWLGWLSTDLVDEVAQAVAFEWLDALAAPVDQTEMMATAADGRTATGSGSFRTIGGASDLLGLLAAGERGKARIAAYVDRHADSLTELQLPLVEALPELAARMVRAGHDVRLEEPHGAGWTRDAEALEAVANIDQDAAAMLLRNSAPMLERGLQSPQPHDVHGLAQFIIVADNLDSGVLDRLLVALDPSAWEEACRSRLTDTRPTGSVHNAKALVERAVRLDGAVGDAARRLTTDGTETADP